VVTGDSSASDDKNPRADVFRHGASATPRSDHATGIAPLNPVQSPD